jgi:large subunit ribosomal protein L25
MAKIHSLSAKKRDNNGTAIAKKLRREGRIPSVIYGGKQDNYSMEVDLIEIRNLLSQSASDNVLVRLNIEGAREQDKLALIQDVQHHPITRSIIHVDFHAVSENEEIVASVPLGLVGDSVGVNKGGLLDQQLHALDVRCLPGDLPEKLEGDITNVEVGGTLTVGEVTWPKGVSHVVGEGVVVALVAELRALRSEEEEAQDAAASGAEEPAAEEAAG